MTTEKLIIQAMMWRQCVIEDNFKKLVTNCISANSQNTSEEEVTITETVVSAEVISRGPNETDGSIYYALINTADSEVTRLATNWSQKDLLYFRKIVDAIVGSDNSSISSTKMLNIGRDDELKLVITAAERVTNKWIREKWLDEIDDGRVALGVRTLLEMNVYLRDHFGLQDCFRCKILCVRGQNCVTCDTKLHNHCCDANFIPNNRCPNCSKQFATGDGEGSQINDRQSNQSNEMVIDSDDNDVNEVDNDDNEDEEQEQEKSKKIRSTRNSVTKTKRTRRR
ncbi:non-structural maintenance of chromosomes element 1 homolog isoform X2 [Oppia nitens]|uniref:non-structural maintenance of chromosomes element 1 homolog isoform X2 n=1 Tax=Oppia nitens TaxID=1686743 RepID=UPI0023DA50FC|nr:non-structural maintenance of chromosomes element 1 homolog isoform X2 [Oppia nitens]